MAFLHVTIMSAVLGRAVDMNVILPEPVSRQWPPAAQRKYPVVFLLHGLSDNYSAWCRYTSIELYARAHGAAVIMPDGGRGFYTDAIDGEKFWSFLSEELPVISAALFPVSLEKKDCFAAGLSMGGYGALKLALHHPERFAAVGVLSPVVDIARRWTAENSAAWRTELKRIFGAPEELAVRGNDLVALAKARLAEKRSLCPILSFCGEDDFMIEDNRRFNAAMAEIAGGQYHAYLRPGTHDWTFWDRHIRDVFAFFFDRQLPPQE